MLSLTLLGCSRESPVSSSVNTPTPKSTIIASPSDLANTNNPSSTSKPSFTPRVTPEKPASPTSTFTPIPTISDQGQFVEHISFTVNNECTLPCLAGISPGKTNWEEALHLTAPYEGLADVRKYIDIENSPLGSENALSVYFLNNDLSVNLSIGSETLRGDMIVNSILMTLVSYQNDTKETGWRLLHKYGLDMKSLLLEYGMPEIVFLSTDFGVPEFPEVSISTLFIYPEYKFLILYPRRGIVDNDSLMSCEPSDHLVLTIVDDGEKINSIDALTTTLETKKLNIEYWTPYEEVTNVPIDTFYEEFILSSTGCFSFPIDAWQFMLDY